MLSNKLTFSLASLIVLLAFAFVATTVMAAPGGPTVSITEYSGLADPNAAAGATNLPHVQERNNFRVKIAFSEAVTGFDDDGDVEILAQVSPSPLYTTPVTFDETDAAALIPVTTPASDIGKVWVAVIDISSDANYTYGSLRVRVPADMAEANDDATGNQQGSAIFSNLPKGTPYTINATLVASTFTAADLASGKLKPGDGSSATGASFDVKFTASGATGPITVPTGQVQVLKADGTNVIAEYEALTGGNLTFTAGEATATFTILAATTSPSSPVTIGINPNYATGMMATVPPPDAPTPDPTVTVDISEVAGSLDTTAMTVKVRFTFDMAQAMMDSNIVVTSDAEGMMAASVFIDAFRGTADNKVYVATIDYSSAALPLYVNTDIDVASMTVNGEASTMPLMVSAPAPPLTDADLEPPTGVMVVPNTDGDAYTVSWTPPADATGVNGYYVNYNPSIYVAGATSTMVDLPDGVKPTSVSVGSTVDMSDRSSSADFTAPTGTATSTDLTTLADLSGGDTGGGQQPGGGQMPSTVTVSAGSGTDTLTLSGSIAANGFAVISAADLPDLNAFFVVGGTISLIADAGTGATARTAKDVVISEIMWGLDQAQPVASQANQQFIELYNTTGAAIDLTGAMLSLDRTAVLPAAATGKVHLDQVSNVYLAGWVVDVGQSGRLGLASQTFTPTDLVSMYRNIDYVRVEKTDHKTDATENRKEQLKDLPDGKKKDSWKASTKYSVVNIRSTPGAKHVVSVKVLTPTAVPYSPVIINEIGNLTGDANDWIELRAVADANLKKYELASIVGGVETTLVQFPDKDYKLVSGEILLIVNKDPRDTPLARGKKFGDADGITPDVDQENRGVSHDVSMFYDAKGGLDKMPEDGDFLLILRSEAKNNHEKIIDLVGTDFHADTSAAYRTALFPLQGAAAGHGNVIDGGGDDEFDAPGAYKRNDAKGGTGEKDWGPVGYTGIGYDREAATGDASGGTPGFPNDALKEKGLASDTITISEVMVNSRGNRYPQWIELRNSSTTNGVNLNGWKLRVENVSDTGINVRRNFNIDLSGHIPPNRAILVVTRQTSTRSRVIQDSQILNLNTPETKKVLEAEQSRFTILSTDGFTLELFEKDQKTTDTPVDTVTVTDDQLTEESIGTSRQRVSLVRAYLDGSPGNLFSANISGQIANEGSYYGAQNDISTPGNYPGSALPVSLSSFRPVRDKATGEVVIRWITQSELNNAGFNILRSETKTGEFKVVNVKGIIPGHGTTSEKHVYTWTDTSAKPNVVYYYQIEDVSLDGDRTTLATTHLRGNVNAAGKLTTRWSELKTYGK